MIDKKEEKVKENNSGNGKNFHLLPFIICHIVYEDEEEEIDEYKNMKKIKT